VRHFGGEVAQAAPAPAPASAVAGEDQPEKRVEREAPQLVSLVKQAGVSLQKVGLSDHRAKVCLCLDISGSMGRLYKEGLVQRFAGRILALGCKFDDDGEIDVFLFGKNVHHPAPMALSNCNTYGPGHTAPPAGRRHALWRRHAGHPRLYFPMPVAASARGPSPPSCPCTSCS
jgi:hypothetical protein